MNASRMRGQTDSPYSLSLRLTAWYALSSLTLLCAATGFLYWVLASNLNRESDLFLADKVNVVSTILRERPANTAALREEVELESAARQYARVYIRILNGRGEEVMSTPGMDKMLGGLRFPPAGKGGNYEGVRADVPGGHPFRLLSAAVPAANSPGDAWQMQLAVDRSGQRDLLARYHSWLWLVLLVALVFSPLIGYRIARHGASPIKQIATTARRISSSNLNERIQPAGYPIELLVLAETFNAMLDRLESSFLQLSDFSANLANELRTPVNNIRGEAEVALTRARSAAEYREVLSSCLEETVRHRKPFIVRYELRNLARFASRPGEPICWERKLLHFLAKRYRR